MPLGSSLPFTLLCRRREEIALAADRDEHTRCVGAVPELFPQASDLHVDRASRYCLRIDAPDARENLVARDDATRVAGEIAEQVTFALGQGFSRSVVEPDFAAAEVGDAPRHAHRQAFTRPFGRTAQDGF